MQYARWLQEEVQNVDIEALENFSTEQIDSYDCVVIGSRAAEGRIMAQAFLETYWQQLKHKYVYLYVVGLLPVEHSLSVAAYYNIPQYIRDELIGYTKLPGKVKFRDQTMFEQFIARFRKEEEDDLVDRRKIKPIVEALQKLKAQEVD